MVENLIRINGGITINIDVSKKRNVYEKDYIWNPATCSCENGEYLGSVMNDSAIIYIEIIESYDEETKTIPTSFNQRKQPAKRKISTFYLHFY